MRVSCCASGWKHMENLQEKDKVRKSLKECGFTKAGPCKWVLAWKRTSSDHNLYRFEAARGLWDCESEIEEPENQEIKDQSFSAVVVLIHKAQGCVRRQRPVSERNEVKSLVGNKSDSSN